MDAATIQTPRDARSALNRMEGWLRRNEARFEPTDLVVLRGLFEQAHTPAHALALREELERRLRREPLLAPPPRRPRPHRRGRPVARRRRAGGRPRAPDLRPPPGQGARVRDRIARSVGRVDGATSTLEAHLARLGVPVVLRSPQGRRKLDADAFRALTRYPAAEETTQHERDAAFLVYGYTAAALLREAERQAPEPFVFD